MKNHTLIKYIVTLLLPLISLANASAKDDEVKVSLAWLKTGQYAPFMLADTQGFFARQHIKVTLIDGGPGKNPVPMVGAGQAQFGIVAGAEVLLARMAPVPVNIVAIGAITQKFPYAYIKLGNPSDPDPKPKDLEGKKVGIHADGQVYLDAMVKRNNLDASTIKVQTIKGGAEPLLIGQVDYMATMINNQTYQVEQEALKANASSGIKGKTWKAISFDTYGVPLYGDVIFANGDLIKSNPDLVRRFMLAVGQGLDYLLKNPEKSVEIVKAYPGQIEDSEKLIWRFNMQSELSVSADAKVQGLMWMSPEKWQQGIDFYKEIGRLHTVETPKELMTNDFNPRIKAQ